MPLASVRHRPTEGWVTTTNFSVNRVPWAIGTTRSFSTWLVIKSRGDGGHRLHPVVQSPVNGTTSSDRPCQSRTCYVARRVRFNSWQRRKETRKAATKTEEKGSEGPVSTDQHSRWRLTEVGPILCWSKIWNKARGCGYRLISDS